MAATYTLISSNVLSSSAASVTFSAIPATYTDLVLRISGRSDRAVTSQNFYVQLNSASFDGTYSWTSLRGQGSAASSVRTSADGAFYDGYIQGTSATSTSFNSSEYYFPNYAGSTNKIASSFTAVENNTTTIQYLTVGANLRTSNSAITSIVISLPAGNLITDSSFYLYGISNA
jgi:hypothetical protein